MNLAIDLLILFVVVLYLALVYWTYADARRRVYDPMLIGCATVAALLFPFVGVIIYTVLRPPEYLEDVRERELETQAAEVRLRQLNQALCPYCDYRVERDFIRCPSCLRKLKERCVSCSRPLEQTWTICPYCEADVPSLAPARSRRRRGGTALETDLVDIEVPLATDESEGERTAPALASEPYAGPGERRSPSPPRPGRRDSRPRPSS